MTSIKRVYRACRAIIAELALNTYFISTGILLVSTIMILYSSSDGNRYDGVLGKIYFELDPELMASLVTGIGWLSATIISGTIVNKHFKEENRAIRYLSLPLSNGERFATLLLINWLFVSIVSFLPLVLLVFLTYFLRPDALLMPWPGYYVHWLLAGPLIHLITMAFWLFPTIAYVKKAWYAILGIIAVFSLYINSTRGKYSDFVDLEYTPTSFEATDVVGLSKYEFLERQITEVSFEVPDPQSLQLVFVAIVVVLMLVAAYIALTRKTA